MFGINTKPRFDILRWKQTELLEKTKRKKSVQNGPEKKAPASS